MVTTKVKTKLFDDNILRGVGISVDIFGEDVTLTGTVRNAKAIVATGVESNKATGASETFPASTDKVYCFLQAADIFKDREVSFVWFNEEKETLKTMLPMKMGKRWRTYAD